MKIENIKLNKCYLISLQLIKSRVYKQCSDVWDKSFNYNEIKLKKALKIIYNYHMNNKQIFFVGIPSNVKLSVLKFSKISLHVFISESTWITGVLSNKVSIFRYIQNKIKQNSDNRLNSLISINRKPKLIVLSNLKLESIAFKEASQLRIPTIVINNNKSLTLNTSYTVFANFHLKSSKLLSNVFYSLLVSILKICPKKRKFKTFSKKRNNNFKINIKQK